MKKYLKWIIFTISFIIFIILSILVLSKKDIAIDALVYNKISSLIKNNLTNNIKLLTYLGSGVVVIGITVFVIIFFKNKKYGLFLSIDLALITIIQIILKNIFTRSRPLDIVLIKEKGYSFPSGHSLTSMAFYGLIIYLIYNSKLKRQEKIIYITLFSIFILIVGLSRIYLGVHFFTDVVGGFTFSICFLIIYTSIIKDKL